MNGTSFLLDTNIILYLLSGDKTIASIINEKEIYVSFITEMELLSYKKISIHEDKKIKNLLSDVFIVEMNISIKAKAIEIRKENTIKLPDCIIAATAEHLDIPLLTSDEGFKKIKSIKHLLYQ